MPSVRAAEFLLEPDLSFLNHGSFGACPRVVLEAQSALRARLERDPVRFLALEIESLLDAARREAAAFVDSDPDDFVFVRNATTAVNTVLAAFPLEAGDEVLVTDHGYAACRNAAEHWANRAGAAVVEARVPWPVDGDDSVVECILAKVGPKTRLAIIDHVTSPSALVLPVERLVRELQALGVVVLVDGAHAPGMVPLSVRAIGAEYYTGNFHKWCCAPKGAAFLAVAKARQKALHPLVVSHGRSATRTDRPRLWLEFDWVGSEDPSAYLAVPDALHYLEGALPAGIAAVREHNRNLALSARHLLRVRLGAEPSGPESMVGAMATLTLPARGWPQPEVLYRTLLEQHRIQVPVFKEPGRDRVSLRVSAQIYNALEDYQRLVNALETMAGDDDFSVPR